MSKVVTVHGHTLELDMGPSCPNPGIRRQLDAKGEPYMCTSDLTTWIGIDGDWYRIYKPSITLEWPGILELAETEDELLDYLEPTSSPQSATSLPTGVRSLASIASISLKWCLKPTSAACSFPRISGRRGFRCLVPNPALTRWKTASDRSPHIFSPWKPAFPPIRT